MISQNQLVDQLGPEEESVSNLIDVIYSILIPFAFFSAPRKFLVLEDDIADCCRELRLCDKMAQWAFVCNLEPDGSLKRLVK